MNVKQVVENSFQAESNTYYYVFLLILEQAAVIMSVLS